MSKGKQYLVFLIVFFLMMVLICNTNQIVKIEVDYRIQSNQEEWNGKTAKIQGEVHYNYFRIGTIDFYGTVILDDVVLDYAKPADAGGAKRNVLRLSYPNEYFEYPGAFFLSEVGPGAEIPLALGVDSLYCEYFPDTHEFLMDWNEGDPWFRFVPIYS